ncbi:probable G-protein coupled receptor 25 [Podarcis lilfordi]|uniref:Probable G-protein coupled receptor 25 n=1 Tax=Podarcis lilfordi TaxID=74358 RepID=A0AA35KFP9_9SAUR|nr:probable G-protein coupled receptor 25 [Podarcis lilfordi]
MEPAQMVTGSSMTETWSGDFESSAIDNYGDLVNYEICHLQELPYAYIFIPTVYYITFLIGFFGNLFVILLMARKEGRKRLVDTFVLNLAVADLVFVCTLPFWAVSKALGYWCFGEGLCKLSSYAITVNRCSSILFLMGMSVERFLVMTKQWDSRTISTKKSIAMSCGCIWVFSLLLGMPSLFYRKLNPVDDKYLCHDEPSPTFSLIMLILTFLLPLGVILFCYCSIFSKLQSHVHLGKRRNNALKIIFAIVGAFIFSWLPFNVLKVFFVFTMAQDIHPRCSAMMALTWGLTISACLAFANSCVNPIIYVFMDQQFRQQALKHFPDFCSKRGNVQSSALSFSSTDTSLLFASRKKPTPATSARAGDPESKGVGL